MPSLHDTIHELAEVFARGVLDALREATLAELVGKGLEEAPSHALSGAKSSGERSRSRQTRAKGGRERRKSTTDVAPIIDRIVTVLREHPNGLRAERLRTELGLERDELSPSIATALSSGQISKRGANRGTTYFLAASARAEAAPREESAKKEIAAHDVPAKRPKSPAKPEKKRRGALVVYADHAGKAADSTGE